MIQLYYHPISFNSRRVWVALLEKGLDFELIPLQLNGDQFSENFMALSPFHHIPVLIDGDLKIIESLAILDYIEAQYPQPPLLPASPPALALVRMVQMVTVNELLPPTIPLIQDRFGFAEIPKAQLEASKQSINTALGVLENWLDTKPYFSGDSLTMADIVAGTAIPILPSMGISLEAYPHLESWSQRLQQRTSWQQTQPDPSAIESYKGSIKELMAKNR